MEGTAEEIQKQIEERISELPADIQNAILSSEFNQKIQTIGTGNRLHVDQIQELSDFTMLLMLGFMNEGEYQKELTALVTDNSNLAQKLSNEVNQQILLPIRESMKAFAARQNTPQVAPSAPPAVNPSAVVPVQTPKPVVSSPVAAPAPTPTVPMVPKVDMHPADIALTEPTVAKPLMNPSSNVSVPSPTKPVEVKVEPPKPQDYKADPYREPIN